MDKGGLGIKLYPFNNGAGDGRGHRSGTALGEIGGVTSLDGLHYTVPGAIKGGR